MNATEHDGLLQAIIEQPHDNGLCRIYADWLEDNGDEERAEFIRLQLQLGDPNATDVGRDQRKAMFERLSQLLNDNSARWAPWYARSTGNGVVWDRGFIIQFNCTLECWCGLKGLSGSGPLIVASHPIEKVKLMDRKAYSHLEVSEECGWWASDNPIDADDLPRLLWDRLPDRGNGLILSWYPTEAIANDALSKACIALAKKRRAHDRSVHP